MVESTVVFSALLDLAFFELGKLERAGYIMADQLVILNQWR